ncbi:MAG: T9SS C-terminal target domain-containing protein, partial [Bacteroidetes bacterium]
FSSNLVLDENGPFNNWGTSNHSEEDIDQIMSDYMGITTYPKMTNLPYDAIHHIDMHMKLLDEERILVGEYPEGIADGPQIEANIQYVLNNFVTPYGNPYEIIRVPMPPENGAYPNFGGDYRTYANAIFLNKTILVPTYEEQYDTTGLRIWQEAMPGYNIVGINCNQIIPASGALHCITKEVGTDDPLLVNHEQVRVDICSSEETYLSASIKHSSGIASAKVYYTTDISSGYESMDMAYTDNDIWEVYLPAAEEEATIHYYFEAEANSGKTILRPLTAPAGYFDFDVVVCVNTSEIDPEATRLLDVFPNPASAITCIPVENESPISASIELNNVLGQTIKTIFRGEIPAGESKYFFDAAQLDSGMYFIRLKSGNSSIVQSIVVK